MQDHTELPQFAAGAAQPLEIKSPRLPTRKITIKDTVRLPGKQTITDQDRVLSNRLLYLMSLLEQGRVHLEAARGQPATALGVVADMIGRALDCAGKLDDHAPAVELLRQGEKFLDAVQKLEDRLAGSPWQQFLKWLGSESAMSPKCRRRYQEVLEQAADFLDRFCRHCASCFTTPVAAVEWCDTYQPFLKEVRDTIDQLKA